MTLADQIMSHIKFFPRDVISGKANKLDDEFQAMFMGRPMTFRVIELHSDFFFAAAV